MSTEVTKVPDVLTTLSTTYKVPVEALRLAKRSFAPTLRAEEFELFVYQCAARGLNILDGDVKPIVVQGKLSIHVGIEARRKIAFRSGLVVGIETEFVYQVGDKNVRSPFRPSPDAKLVGCLVTVKRKLSKDSDVIGTFSSYAELTEYAGEKGDRGNYKNMQHVMLQKSAEMLALRQAVPEEFSGLYDENEFATVTGAKVIDRVEAEVVESNR